MPYDVGLQTEIGRTSKGSLAALPEESPAPIVDEGEKEAPTFKFLPRPGGGGGGGGGGGVCGETLRGSLSFSLYAAFLLCQHL